MIERQIRSVGFLKNAHIIDVELLWKLSSSKPGLIVSPPSTNG